MPYKNLFIAVACLLGITLMGAVGYVLIEGWSFFDGLYMTVITVVGLSEVIADLNRSVNSLVRATPAAH